MANERTKCGRESLVLQEGEVVMREHEFIWKEEKKRRDRKRSETLETFNANSPTCNWIECARQITYDEPIPSYPYRH